MNARNEISTKKLKNVPIFKKEEQDNYMIINHTKGILNEHENDYANIYDKILLVNKKDSLKSIA